MDAQEAVHLNFNSRPCVRGDPLEDCLTAYTALHFNSRPCMRGDRIALTRIGIIRISIHAPA